jgi:hypothetical protein
MAAAHGTLMASLKVPILTRGLGRLPLEENKNTNLRLHKRRLAKRYKAKNVG